MNTALPTAPASNRITQIAAQLRAADLAYYNTGEATMEDAAYDALKDELRTLAPDHELLKVVGAAPTEMLAKVAHSIPMGSLDKAMNEEEFRAWAATMPASIFTASFKADGGSIEKEYQDGRLIVASTRGDGKVGEDITANALQFQATPKSGVVIDGKPFTGFVRSEVILTNEDWKKADPDQVSNPRNLGNGIARRKDGEQAELLSTIAFRAFYKDGTPIADTEADMLAKLTKAGFTVSPNVTGTIDEVWKFFTETQTTRPTLAYWIDGMVVKIDDLATQLSLGERDQRPRGQIAIKFPAEGARTVLRSVELTVGHTGAIIPTGKFDPVQIGGTTITSALLCNWDVITALDIAIGDTVTLIKAGDIIPKVLEVLERPASRTPIAEPTVCPECGGPIGRKQNVHGEQSAMLYCLNEECPAKAIGKIDRYIRSLNILGIGDEVLAALAHPTQGVLKTPADLYTLKNHQDFLEGLLIGDKRIRLGAQRAKKILDEIDAKRDLTLSELIGSLGIEKLGKRRVAQIQAAIPGQFDTLEDWTAGKLAGLAVAAGVPNMGKYLSDSVVNKAPLITSFIANGVRIKASAPKTQAAPGAKSFCFTGASSVPRKQLVAMAEAKGHTVKDDVSAGLDYLVLADPSSTSSKAVKARKLGTQCISEDHFRQLVA